uniref:Venom peptide Os3a n=1 Tax=Oncocephalus sp. TaxID=2944721 RepID=A0AB38ZEM0_9HEMI
MHLFKWISFLFVLIATVWAAPTDDDELFKPLSFLPGSNGRKVIELVKLCPEGQELNDKNQCV